ncbi:Pet117p KNAG_0L01460 [Huiozyma naganishii CBS 8797]|uniref:Uncharacterized protein n=1 Tax=Huiozyma naganishii (strain ATCC MYA-139 / BCRC 22969 / CBS 8797 / KCTC 17520 / NBRC 10181 / NCYC 3082 / Yp74L-3) TaxID=1071383 RepID=J7SB58_HUIN7|nr:hypothetical protein KNAG_0L01460 [Kazachstania naganishii CBS 8797]CCK72766.1 hypothetical protein KNAG_0L01460 [Kazachstania naganishii CBS 8797]
MSRASKITFGLSCLFTVTAVVGVHMIQDLERDTLHQGPIKDAKRLEQKREERRSLPASPNDKLDDAAREKKRQFNKTDHEMQQELRKKYESIQPLSGEIVTRDQPADKGQGK